LETAMPPPSLNQQGSRAGLITAVVILSILFVTSAIFAFYFSAENSKKETSLKNVTDNLTKYANSEAQVDPAVTALVEARNEAAYQGQSAIQVALNKLGNLSKAVAGTPNADPQAITAAVANAEKELKEAGVSVELKGSLVANFETLAGRVKELAVESQKKTEELNAAAEKHKQEVAQRQQVETELNGKFEEQGAQLAAALTQLEAKRNESDASVKTVQGEVERAAKTQQSQLSSLQKQLTDANASIAKLKSDIESYKVKVLRPTDTANPVIRQPDGRIVRVPGNDNVFIDLGEGDGIAPGLTFEVYDRFTGVPGINPEDDVANLDESLMPKGKASIEIVRPGKRQSECRIIRQSSAQPVIEGDIVANLVFDRNTKYNFVVFGNFDLDQDNIPTPRDAEVVKERIVKWGGRLQDEVNVNADFVVLGFEPEVPAQTEDETATEIAEREKKQKEADAYQEVVAKAKDLNIPILNQNRFLYYTGYYEQAQR
jgi:hypothetical protein